MHVIEIGDVLSYEAVPLQRPHTAAARLLGPRSRPSTSICRSRPMTCKSRPRTSRVRPKTAFAKVRQFNYANIIVIVELVQACDYLVTLTFSLLKECVRCQHLYQPSHLALLKITFCILFFLSPSCLLFLSLLLGDDFSGGNKIEQSLCVCLTLLHSEQPKLYGVLAVLSALGLEFQIKSGNKDNLGITLL